jgi:hypothetical protein
MKNRGIMLRNEPYLLINTVFAGVIILIMIYSGIFSPARDNYPVVCLHQRLTGQPCLSCGLSHSFSLIVRGHFGEARKWNVYGLRVFFFFASQLIFRILFSFLWIRIKPIRNSLIIFDAIISATILLISFWPFIKGIVSGVF